MRIFRSIFITFLVLLFCSVGVLAAPGGETPATPPQYYVGGNGQINTIPTSTTGTLQQITGEGAGGTPSGVQNLQFGAAPGTGTAQNPEKWYWAGPSSFAEPIKGVGIENTNGSTTNQGAINIVIPGNGNASEGTMAMVIQTTSAWNLTNGQTINIFQAANSLDPDENSITIGNCIFVLNNDLQAAQSPEPDLSQEKQSVPPTSALTINGGSLNVYSGAFVPSAGNAPGLQINSGNVVVSSQGQLQPTCSVNRALPNPPSETNIYGLSIGDNGSLVNNGYLAVFQNYLTSGDNPKPNWGYAEIEGITGLNVKNGGTVQTSTAYPTNSSNLTNGVWIESSGNGNADTNEGNNPIKATTNNITAFGEATLFTGFSPAIQLTGTNSLTVNSGANLTIPDDYTLTFGTGNSTTTDGTLTVNGTLTISGKATVTMNKGSVLTNNGTINVLEP